MPKGRKKQTFEGLYPEFVEEMRGKTAYEKKLKISSFEAHKVTAKDEIDPKGKLPSRVRDEIVRLTAELNLIRGPYRDTIKACSEKQKYLIEQLKEAGEYQVESATSGSDFSADAAMTGKKD